MWVMGDGEHFFFIDKALKTWLKSAGANLSSLSLDQSEHSVILYCDVIEADCFVHNSINISPLQLIF